MENISYNQAQAQRTLNAAHQAHQETTPGNTDLTCAICQYMTGALLARNDSHSLAIRRLISQPDSTLEWTLIISSH